MSLEISIDMLQTNVRYQWNVPPTFTNWYINVAGNFHRHFANKFKTTYQCTSTDFCSQKQSEVDKKNVAENFNQHVMRRPVEFSFDI